MKQRKEVNMTLYDLYETCVNIDENATIYIHNGTGKKCKVKDAIGQYGAKKIKWFCIRYDEDIEVCFK